MKKKVVSFFLCLIFIFLSSVVFTGCFSGVIGIYVEQEPLCSVYSINDTVSLDGIKIKGINSDGTKRRIRVSEKNIENNIDMTSPGEKLVILNIDGNRTSFNIYIPNFTLTAGDDLKQTIIDAKENDIIYLKAGNYNNSIDINKYKDILINKSLTIIGDKNKTIFNGNFILGINNLNEKQEISLNKVSFFNISFKLNYSIDNGLITYSNPYYNSIVTAIDGNNTSGVYVKNCEFEGFSYAIKFKNAENLSVIKNKFKNIKIAALKTENSTKQTSVYKNAFMDIANNTLFTNENNKQNYVSAIDFSFNSEENSGVIIANNSFSRIGLKTSDFECVNYSSKNSLSNKNNDFQKLSYVNNSAIIILKSSMNNNLKTRGIILSQNSYGTTLNNILFGTSDEDFLNESAVIINNS